MRRNKQNGFSLMEILITIFISGVLIGIVAIGTKNANTNRALEATGREIEGALALARETAPNAGGAVLTLSAPTSSKDGSWTLSASSRNAKTGKIPYTLSLSVTGGSPTITYTSAGTTDANREITLTANTGKKMTWTLNGATGTAQRTEG